MPNVRRDLGYPPLVTPTSQICGSEAALNVLFGRYKMISNEVRDLVRGKYGRVPGEITDEFRKLCIGDEKPITYRPADDLKPELGKAKDELAKEGFPMQVAKMYSVMPFSRKWPFLSSGSGNNPWPHLRRIDGLTKVG